jgi:ribosomal protein S12 methylthiotransferase accessory factor
VAWIPSQLAYLGRPEGDPVVYFVSDSAGCAAAPVLDQAVLSALLELVERDAAAIWWYNRIARPAVCSRAADPHFPRWRRLLRSLNREFRLFDLTADLEIPVFAAVSWSSGGKRPGLGFGCHPDPALAAQRALRELCQTSIAVSFDRTGRYPRRSEEAAFLRWAGAACVSEEAHLKPSSPVRELPRAPREPAPARELLRTVLGALRRFGLEAWLLPVTRPELGIPAVRVVCGELRHPGHRLAPGRLYDVPARLGWIGRPRLEAEMNPVPCLF